MIFCQSSRERELNTPYYTSEFLLKTGLWWILKSRNGKMATICKSCILWRYLVLLQVLVWSYRVVFNLGSLCYQFMYTFRLVEEHVLDLRYPNMTQKIRLDKKSSQPRNTISITQYSTYSTWWKALIKKSSSVKWTDNIVFNCGGGCGSHKVKIGKDFTFIWYNEVFI